MPIETAAFLASEGRGGGRRTEKLTEIVLLSSSVAVRHSVSRSAPASGKMQKLLIKSIHYSNIFQFMQSKKKLAFSKSHPHQFASKAFIVDYSSVLIDES